MDNIRFNATLDHFPDDLQDECTEAFREGLNEGGGRTRNGLIEADVRRDEAQKAKHTYESIHA